MALRGNDPDIDEELPDDARDGGGAIAIPAPPDAAPERIDRFLADRIGTMSRSRVKAMIGEGLVSCDGAPCREPAAPVRPGALYVVAVPAPVSARPLSEAIPLVVLHEDDDLIVIDKPAGLVVHPAPGNETGTLVNALLAHCGASLTGIGGERRPGIVHRLDKDTSGVMVAAKNEVTLAALSAAFAERRLERSYLALAWGLVAPGRGAWDGPIGRDPRERKRMAVVARGGKEAGTDYVRLATSGTALSLLRCRLRTGRTHQIRVHAAEAGHPLVGDPVYLRRTPAAARCLPSELRDTLLDFPRQALHARTLGFHHPRTAALLRFEAAPPADLAALLAAGGLPPDDVSPA